MLLILQDPVFGEHYMAELISEAKTLPLYSKEESREAVNRELEEALRQFRLTAPRDLTGKLSYRAGSWDVSRMISSVVAHGGWDHVIGNLLGFLAFGILVEAILGSILFPVALLAIAVISNVAFSLWHMGTDSPQAVVGLSGVVYGTMGLLAYFWPGARVRCLLWVVVLFKRIAVPVWTLAILYIGWDVYDMVKGKDLGVSLISHVSGGISGFVLGWLAFRWRKKQLTDIVSR
jgi:membrane associated rhomboid family serine protease